MERSKVVALLSMGIVMLAGIGGISTMSVKYKSEHGGTERTTSFVWGAKAKLRNVIELPLSEVENLTLEYGSKNIKVYPSGLGSSKDTIVIEEYLYSDEPGAKASVSEVKEKEILVTGGKGHSFVLFGFWGGEERIEVYVPEKSLKQFSLQTGSGNITSETDCVRGEGSLTVSTGSGNIRWKNVEASKISFQAGSGNVYTENLKGREIRLHAGSGNITGERVEGSTEVSAGSGNVKLESFAGSGKMETNSGNVTVRAEGLTGDLALRAGSGNVKLELTAGIPFHFQAETGSGNIRTDFDKKLSYNKKGNYAEGDVGEKPELQVRARTGSGNVSVSNSSANG